MLVDQVRGAQVLQDRGGFGDCLRRVVGQARVERLALAHRAVEGAHRLLERGVRVEAWGVEDIDVVQPIRDSDWSRLARTFLREPHSPYGPGHMRYPALLAMKSSSR
ncbi:hypothetical protein GCM10017744_007870 [Streptomyces antimycoticus]